MVNKRKTEGKTSTVSNGLKEMQKSKCFVCGCNHLTKVGNGKIFSCEKHENLFFKEFIKPLMKRKN